MVVLDAEAFGNLASSFIALRIDPASCAVYFVDTMNRVEHGELTDLWMGFDASDLCQLEEPSHFSKESFRRPSTTSIKSRQEAVADAIKMRFSGTKISSSSNTQR